MISSPARTGGANGLAPFSPDAHNVNNPSFNGPNFGFTAGIVYTLKWPAPDQLRQRGLPGRRRLSRSERFSSARSDQFGTRQRRSGYSTATIFGPVPNAQVPFIEYMRRVSCPN